MRYGRLRRRLHERFSSTRTNDFTSSYHAGLLEATTNSKEMTMAVFQGSLAVGRCSHGYRPDEAIVRTRTTQLGVSGEWL